MCGAPAQTPTLPAGIDLTKETVIYGVVSKGDAPVPAAYVRLLDSTGEFVERPQKRYDDTQLLISAFCEFGYESDFGKRAIRRMNEIHCRFEIANEDFLYVLSTMVFEPIRWNARFGWRPLIPAERLANFFFWREVGRRMNIKEIPESYGEFEAFNVEFERTRFAYTDAGARVAAAQSGATVGVSSWGCRWCSRAGTCRPGAAAAAPRRR